MLEKFVPGHEINAREHSHPCNPSTFIKLACASSDEEREKMKRLPYQQLIGSLLYLACMTRPDIAYHMSILCKFMQDPSMDCYTAAISLLLYTGHTKHKFLHYDGTTTPHDGFMKHREIIESNAGFHAYSDASWSDPHKFGFNMFGYVCYLYGGPVSFASKLLKVVALSTAEAEYAAASYTCKEITFLRQVCNELGVALHGKLALGVDNTAAIEIANNMGVTGRNKHFIDAIHYFRDQVDRECIMPIHVTTDLQRADGFTKPVKDFIKWMKWLLC